MDILKSASVLAVLTLFSTGLAANCKKGKACGNSCIPVTSTCHIGAPAPSYTSPQIVPTPAPAPPPIPALTFTSCREARAKGRVNIARAEADYHPDLDRDDDGIACEDGGDDDGAVVRVPGVYGTALNFEPSFVYDSFAEVGTAAFGCKQEVNFSFNSKESFSKIGFSIDRWYGGDWLLRVFVGLEEVYATSTDSENRNVEVGERPRGSLVRINYKALSENTTCPSDVRIRRVGLR